MTNNPGSAARSSAKEILTEPRASCERTFSTGMDTNASAGGVCINFARRSIGNTAMTDGNGNCRPPGPAAGAADGGVTMGCVLDCDEARGNVVREAADAAMEGAGTTVVTPLSSKRRSSPRNNPANFDFTMFDMANYAIPVF